MTDRVPAWSLAVVAMLSVQLGAALSLQLVPVVGAAGTAWLRLTAGALIFLAISRPRLRGMARRDLVGALVLGIATGVITVSFLQAIDRIPLGTAVAIEFLGPLGVAVLRSRELRQYVWPVLALVGVLLVTSPWKGSIDPVGVAYAALAAVGWGTYIVLTQYVGDRFSGLQGLSITIPIAALTAAVVGVPQAAGSITWGVVAASVGLALLLPVLPFSLELLALRRLSLAAFGTLMALEPAIGLTIGAVVLRQIPTVLQIVGIVLVVTAGIGAERLGHREPPTPGAAPPIVD
ncbi:MAG: EamA family transporter [Candidatus Nanopelagicales bacterium]